MNAPFTHTLWPAGLNWLAVFDFCAAGIANQASKEEFFYSKRGISPNKLLISARDRVTVKTTYLSSYAKLGGSWKISSNPANQASKEDILSSKRRIPASKLPFLARNGVSVHPTYPSSYDQIGGNWKISSNLANLASKEDIFSSKRGTPASKPPIPASNDHQAANKKPAPQKELATHKSISQPSSRSAHTAFAIRDSWCLFLSVFPVLSSWPCRAPPSSWIG